MLKICYMFFDRVLQAIAHFWAIRLPFVTAHVRLRKVLPIGAEETPHSPGRQIRRWNTQNGDLLRESAARTDDARETVTLMSAQADFRSSREEDVSGTVWDYFSWTSLAPHKTAPPTFQEEFNESLYTLRNHSIVVILLCLALPAVLVLTPPPKPPVTAPWMCASAG